MTIYDLKEDQFISFTKNGTRYEAVVNSIRASVMDPGVLVKRYRILPYTTVAEGNGFFVHIRDITIHSDNPNDFNK